jgi:uncharacterized Zn-binding protein involved in type VI secretion
VHSERELEEALADPTLGAVALAPGVGADVPVRVTAPVGRVLWVSGHSRVQIGGGTWIEVRADGDAHVEAWDGRIHAGGRAQFLARGQAQVYAGDRSHGTALDAARVIALHDAEVTADGASVVRAGDRVRVLAGGAVYVEAAGEARVHAGPHVVVRRYTPDALITGPGTVLDSTDLDPLDPYELPDLAALLDLPWPTQQSPGQQAPNQQPFRQEPR